MTERFENSWKVWANMLGSWLQALPGDVISKHIAIEVEPHHVLKLNKQNNVHELIKPFDRWIVYQLRRFALLSKAFGIIDCDVSYSNLAQPSSLTGRLIEFCRRRSIMG